MMFFIFTSINFIVHEEDVDTAGEVIVSAEQHSLSMRPRVRPY